MDKQTKNANTEGQNKVKPGITCASELSVNDGVGMVWGKSLIYSQSGIPHDTYGADTG